VCTHAIIHLSYEVYLYKKLKGGWENLPDTKKLTKICVSLLKKSIIAFHVYVFTSDMSAVYLVIGNSNIKGITTGGGIRVFSVTHFINIVCHKTGSYARLLWKRLISDTSKFTEVKEALVLAVPSTKIRKFTTPGMTIEGLQKLLCMLKLDEDIRPIVEDTFARYMNGDTSMLIEVDLNSTVSPENLHYNFEPPLTGSLHKKQKNIK